MNNKQFLAIACGVVIAAGVAFIANEHTKHQAKLKAPPLTAQQMTWLKDNVAHAQTAMVKSKGPAIDCAWAAAEQQKELDRPCRRAVLQYRINEIKFDGAKSAASELPAPHAQFLADLIEAEAVATPHPKEAWFNSKHSGMDGYALSQEADLREQVTKALDCYRALINDIRQRQ